VKEALQDADWAHLALHGDKEKDSLILALPVGGDDDAASELSMHEIQGGEEVEGVRLAKGATAVLSACNTGRGQIMAEGVVGLARGFLVAGAAATVVSLWSVDDGSTSALMQCTYKHLAATGCTVPEALRLAMLQLARRCPAEDKEAPGPQPQPDGEELCEEWKRPMHWAGFLVVGASTRLPCGTTDQSSV
jgi:CHAT domain-containing protein